MADLSTDYLGITLRNPFIVGSCSLTSRLEDIIQLDQAGAGAIVLKSLFEEEILNGMGLDSTESKKKAARESFLLESMNYINLHGGKNSLREYLQLIRAVKNKISVPVIASINCISDGPWIDFIPKIQASGADAIELNISMNPLDSTNLEKERTILHIIKRVVKTVTLPVSIKISDRYSNLYQTIPQFASSGIAGIVLFNRFYYPDVDIYNMSLVQGRMHSGDSEYMKPLRWIVLLSEKIECSIAASSGIHDANTAIKMLLAGADAVQVVSALYLNGKDYLIQLLNELENWMTDMGIFSIKQIRGKASYKKSSDPKIYERIQFMKYYGRVGN